MIVVSTGKSIFSEERFDGRSGFRYFPEDMVAIPNRRTYPGFLLAILPLLWAGICALTWVILSLPPQTGTVAESIRTIFCMLGPFLSLGMLFVLLDSWFGRTIYEARDGWLHTEKNLFGFRRNAFDYDLDLLTECQLSHIGKNTPVDHEELERLRHAGAAIRRKGRTGPEYPAPCDVCRIIYDGQPLVLLAAPSRHPVERLAEFIEAVMRQHREKRP